jgi:hypothetical protein
MADVAVAVESDVGLDCCRVGHGGERVVGGRNRPVAAIARHII